MSLRAGTRIGSYEIGAPIGAGGMGEVYRARDTKLDRDVAIKILPDSFASDPERLVRFEREAKSLAALNHPNIAIVHGFEQAAASPAHGATAINALVMELVDGPTLAERIERGRIPVEEALPIARQIAEALETAHDQGIIHRDLKPANIKVRPDGTVKVLDFGLAKALTPASAASVDAINSPTLTAHATQMGVLIGTAAYMAPEQAKGKPVDRRADIWAFGVVLFEMLSGRRAYEADDVSDTLAAVLMRDVDWHALPADLPDAVHALLRDCLVRDPKQRLRDIGDARRALERSVKRTPDVDAVAAQTNRSSRRMGWGTWVPWGITVASLAVAGGIAAIHVREVRSIPSTVRFQVAPPGKSAISSFALSPDSRYLAFVTYEASGSGPSEAFGARLWVRATDSLDARLLASSVGVSGAANQLFWSPDSTSLAFFAEGKLKRIAIAGGPPQTLAESSPFARGTWGASGVILLSRASAPIHRLSADGGVPVAVTAPAPGESHLLPQFLPDGRHFLYHHTGGTAESNGIHVSSLDSGTTSVRLLPDAGPVRFVPTGSGPAGHLLFIREGTLMAQPFDAERRQLTGEVFALVDTVGAFSVSQDGAIAYRSTRAGVPGLRAELGWVDRSGRPIATAGSPGEYGGFRLASDDRSVVFHRSEDNDVDIWVLDLARNVPSRITFQAGVDNLPIWSPDGQRVLWPSRRSGVFDLCEGRDRNRTGRTTHCDGDRERLGH